MTFDDAWRNCCSKIPGCYDRDEAEVLWRAAERVPDGGLALEIGCERGRSTSVMFVEFSARGDRQRRPRPSLSIVDNFSDHPDDPIEEDFRRNMRETVAGYLLTFGVIDEELDPVIIAKSVFDAVEYEYPGAPPEVPMYDLVHIDADHSWKGVMFDLLFAEKFTTPSGTIVLHDFRRPTIPTVGEAVDDFLRHGGGWRVVDHAGTTVALRRE